MGRISKYHYALGLEVSTYTVVAFKVNVRLVENSVNSHDGRVNVVKVINQYSINGTTFTVDKTSRAKNPSHVVL
jgi:hypothetical protein